ncbi:serine protease [Roseobacter cerasinus]|uniref:serine protease n=1 Tax=Roseobacter cerasinus TaxID=2602289 RepID=UPI001EEA1079|nr:serine protease [Roseobacter cerasinus]
MDTLTQSRSVERSIRQEGATSLDPGAAARSDPRVIGGGLNLDVASSNFVASMRIEPGNGAPRGGLCAGSFIKPRIGTRNSGDVVQGWDAGNDEPDWVITAAHCLRDKNNKDTKTNTTGPEQLTLIAGTFDVAAINRHIVTIGQVIVHPDYDPNTMAHDIALLKIEGIKAPDEQSDFIPRSIQLPARHMMPIVNRDLSRQRVTGWGRTSEGGRVSENLMVADVPLYPRAACQEAYSQVGGSVAPSQFCAGYSTGAVDACSGDSGGPIFFDDRTNPVATSDAPILSGVVSWGFGCARAGAPGVYTSVSKEMTWIEEVVLGQ